MKTIFYLILIAAVITLALPAHAGPHGVGPARRPTPIIKIDPLGPFRHVEIAK